MTWDSSPPGGSITVRRDDAGSVVAWLVGEVDAAVVEAFTTGTDGAEPEPTAVEASEVTFIDSRGLALMLRWATRARERGLTADLRRPSAAVLSLLRISGTGDLFAESTAGGPASG